MEKRKSYVINLDSFLCTQQRLSSTFRSFGDTASRLELWIMGRAHLFYLVQRVSGEVSWTRALVKLDAETSEVEHYRVVWFLKPETPWSVNYLQWGRTSSMQGKQVLWKMFIVNRPSFFPKFSKGSPRFKVVIL